MMHDRTKKIMYIFAFLLAFVACSHGNAQRGNESTVNSQKKHLLLRQDRIGKFPTPRSSLQNNNAISSKQSSQKRQAEAQLVGVDEVLADANEAGTTVIGIKQPQQQRTLQKQQKKYYHIITSDRELGYGNPDATLGNPMRGLVPSPRYLPAKDWINNTLNPSVEFYYIGWDEIMIRDPDKYSTRVAYNWTVLEHILNESASRYAHSAFRLFIHFPGQPLRLPAFLSKIAMKYVQTGDPTNQRTEISPYYGDPKLLRTLRKFIQQFGKRYDGDPRIAAIQLGLLGFWGEWQTCCYNDDVDILPDGVRDKVIQWYASAFSTTKLQMRYEDPKLGYNSKFGRHDDSFAYKTLDGESFFFWPRTKAAGQDDFWKFGVMGGETRPELQPIVFEDWYPAGSPYKQDFMECVATTHATYIFHHEGFVDGGYRGRELQNALYAHARMGYRFRIVQVAAKSQDNRNDVVTIEVMIRQTGVAPFYYPLNIALHCPSLSRTPRLVGGVESLIDKDQNKTFSFRNIPNHLDCLQNVTFTLTSRFLYEERPIKFSQGPHGHVSVSIPTAPPMNPSCRESYPCKTARGHDGSTVSIHFLSRCRQFCVTETSPQFLQRFLWKCGPCSSKN